MAIRPAQIVVVNQHGDNRGDEAAMRAMVSSLTDRLPGARFTVVHQFGERASAIELPDVDYLPLRISVPEAVRLSAWALLTHLGVNVARLPGAVGQRTIAAVESADVVISAPGGPYFGDLYANHEVVHWFYVWLARLHQVPLVYYQPSAGPFRNRLLNPLRRRGYSWFELLAVRESISADHIERLTGRRPRVGSDSAVQVSVPPAPVDDWLAPSPDGHRPKHLVSATFRQPDESRREQHDAAVVAGLATAGSADRRVVLLPQLHGTRHADRGYLTGLAERARDLGADVLVAPDTLSSDEQRGIVAASRFALAGRYHPLVFAAAAHVPVVTIPYEHKARGFAESAGLGEWIIELDDLSPTTLCDRIADLAQRRDAVSATLAERVPRLRDAALSTSDATASIAERRVAGR